MIVIFSHFFIFFFISYLNGYFFYNKFFKKLDFNIYDVALLGLCINLFCSQFINFFFPLNDLVIITNTLIVLIYFFFKKKDIINHIYKTPSKIIIIPLLFLVFLQIFGSNFSDDINHYHYSSVANADNFSFIIGNSFLNPMFGTSSLWLTGHAFYNFNSNILQDIHIFNSLIFFIVVSSLTSKLDLKSKDEIILNILILTMIFYFMFKFTRLKEFGIDRQVILLYSYLIIFFYLNFVNLNSRNIILNFIIICIFSLTIISIKISYLTILFLPLLIAFRYFKEIFQYKIEYFIILFFIIIFVSKNFLSSGCFIFPLNFTCIKSIPWTNEVWASRISLIAETLNKSWDFYDGNLNKEIYIKNFNWFTTWFLRIKTEISEYLILVFLILILISFCFKNVSNNINNFFDKKIINQLIFMLVGVLFLSLLIFLFKNPVIRMNHHLILSFTLIVLLMSLKWRNVNSINKKLLIVFLIAAFIFNIAKNIKRISSNQYVNDPLYFLKSKITEQTYYELNGLKFYKGWYGNTPMGNKSISDKKYKKFLNFHIIYK